MFLIGFFRGIALTFLILLFCLTSFCVQILFCFSPLRLGITLKLTSFFCRLALQVLNIHPTLRGRQLSGHLGPYFIISNHLSYIDVLVLFAFFPSVYVTSVEVSEDWFLGTLCQLAGCYFVERRKRGKLHTEISALSRLLDSGYSVVVFPEGTTSDGRSILQFKSSLLKVAQQSKTPILPLCLNYRSVSEVPTHELYWYGDAAFFSHLLGVLCHPKIEIEVTTLDPVLSGPTQSRRELGHSLREYILSAYRHST